MLKARIGQSKKSIAKDLALKASGYWDAGKLRPAFRMFLAAAKAGNLNAQLDVGYFYDMGIGTRQDHAAALYWYQRAFRRGDGCAAHNIGTIWRDAKKPKRALAWFERAVRLGSEDSNLEIAKYYLQEVGSPNKAIPYLEKVRKSKRVAKADVKEAMKMMNEAKRKLV